MARLSRRPAKIDIEAHLPALVRLLAARGEVLAAYLYGSYGTPDQTPLSDVDLAVLLEEGAGEAAVFALQAGVLEVTGEEDVNLVVLNKLPVTVQFEVIATGRLIYARSEEKLGAFLERVFKIYGDFMLDYQVFCAEYDAALREAYGGGR